MKGRSQMTSAVFGYDHIMMRAEYRTPDPHSHLAVHFIAGLDGPVHCVVSGDSFDADAVFIASDVVHTAYAETGDMLVFLFDTAGSIAKEAQKQYLCGRPYFCGDKETVEKLREIWKNNPPSQADSLITQLLGLDTVGNTLRDERISQVLEYLRSLDEVPEDMTAQLCAKVCLSPSRLSDKLPQHRQQQLRDRHYKMRLHRLCKEIRCRGNAPGNMQCGLYDILLHG